MKSQQDTLPASQSGQNQKSRPTRALRGEISSPEKDKEAVELEEILRLAATITRPANTNAGKFRPKLSEMGKRERLQHRRYH